MICAYCKGTGWFLYNELAPSPPYKQGQQLEFAKRCVCQHDSQRPTQNFEGSED